jgi:N-hydroxyarylamine O-acetyltransferase
LRLDDPDEQPDPGGTFRVERTDEGDLDVFRDGEPRYRVWTRPQALGDFATCLWWHTTRPSHFGRAVICSLTTVDGRLSLAGDRLVRTAGGQRSVQPLPTDVDVLEAYRVHFGLTLPRRPRSRYE